MSLQRFEEINKTNRKGSFQTNVTRKINYEITKQNKKVRKTV